MITAIFALALGGQLATFSYAHTFATAIAPVLTMVLFIPVRLIARRLEATINQARENKLISQRENQELRKQLAEAKAVIRGDLANGIKHELEQIHSKVSEVKDQMPFSPTPSWPKAPR